ncbi:MAG: hypothetical protein Q4C47_04635, partial [Planctomycetia bacterium]|nr:hypothetical protein [Planctomycetia bacterium]
GATTGGATVSGTGSGFVWNVAIEPILVGSPGKILVPGKESMLRDFLAEMAQIREMAFPRGVPFDAGIDAPLIPETFHDPENDFDPDNDPESGDDPERSAFPRHRPRPETDSAVEGASEEARMESETESGVETELVYDHGKIAELFPLLDEYLELSARTEDPQDSGIDSGHDVEDDSMRDGTERIVGRSGRVDRRESAESPEESEEIEWSSTSPGAVDPVLWRQWLSQAARWSEDPRTFRAMLREASLLGVDLLDGDDDSFHGPTSSSVSGSTFPGRSHGRGGEDGHDSGDGDGDRRENIPEDGNVPEYGDEESQR